MCTSTPKYPKYDLPVTYEAPEPEKAPDPLKATDDEKSTEKTLRKSRRRGSQQLRTSLEIPAGTYSANGLTIPKG